LQAAERKSAFLEYCKLEAQGNLEKEAVGMIGRNVHIEF